MQTSLIVAGQVLLMVGLGLLLIKSTRLTASAIEALVNHSRQRKFGLVVFFVALSMSMPELVMTVMASAKGQSELALATIMGANIANISIILGGAALIAGSLRASDTVIKKEIAMVFLISCLPLLLLMDEQLSRLEGMGLMLLYGVYIYREFEQKTKITAPPKAEEQIKQLLHQLRNHSVEKRLLLAGVGITGMLVAAELLVRVAVSLSRYASISTFLVGLFVLAVSSSLPELLFEIVAIRHKQSTMAFGNIIGSIVANVTVILGLAAAINPITLDGNRQTYLISNLGFILIFGLFWWFTKTKHRLDRLEGLGLVGVFGLFGIIQFLAAR